MEAERIIAVNSWKGADGRTVVSWSENGEDRLELYRGERCRATAAAIFSQRMTEASVRPVTEADVDLVLETAQSRRLKLADAVAFLTGAEIQMRVKFETQDLGTAVVFPDEIRDYLIGRGWEIRRHTETAVYESAFMRSPDWTATIFITDAYFGGSRYGEDQRYDNHSMMTRLSMVDSLQLECLGRFCAVLER